MHLRTLVLLGASAAIVATASADARVVYDNGPINGRVTAWTLYSAQYVTESFMLAQSTTITGFTFGGWTSAGAQITSVGYGFSDSTYGVILGNSALTASSMVQNAGLPGYDIRTYTGSVAPITFTAGTHYFTLSTSTTTDNNYAYWDINNGPSHGYLNGVDTAGQYGSTSSTAFTLLAGGTVPEPASWALMLGGFGLVGGALRSRKRTFPTAS